jgi:hypothetical protein
MDWRILNDNYYNSEQKETMSKEHMFWNIRKDTVFWKHW